MKFVMPETVLRQGASDKSMILAAETFGQKRLYVDPDRFGLGRAKSVETAEPATLILRDLRHTAVTAIRIGGETAPALSVTRDGGHIVTDKNNFLIALAPYFFPLYSILAIAVYGLLSLFCDVQPYGRLLYAVIGVTWAFHFTFTCWMIPKNQTDLSDHGTFFSLVVIYLMNLTLLSIMLVLAARQITFLDLGTDSMTNISNFSHWVVDLFDRFSRGAR